MSAEYFDLYDAEGRALEQTKERGAVHRDGDWHRVGQIWIYTGAGEILFQLRSADKDTWPSRLSTSIGGHYQAGEGIDGITREADEELGLSVDMADLVPLGPRHEESIEPGFVDREIQDVYLLRSDLPPAEYILDPDELAGVVLLSTDDAAAIHNDPDARAIATLYTVDGRHEQRLFGPADVIPGRAAYMSAVTGAVETLLAGGTITTRLPL